MPEVDEPLLDAADIQGNILPGFRRTQQFFAAFRSGDAAALRTALRLLAPQITPLGAVLPHREARKAAFKSGMAPPMRDDLWLNLALGRNALRILGVTSIEATDLAFRNGMVPSATGDSSSAVLPDGRPNPAHPDHWVVGGPNRPVDLLCIFAGDGHIEQPIADIIAKVEAAGLQCIFRQAAGLLDGDIEHFGFVDGISQPGPRGVTEIDGVRQHITTRYGVPPVDGQEFGKPGQVLTDPGQFLFIDNPDPVIKNGSFLVLRQLTQDVARFYAETDQLAVGLTSQLPAPVSGAELRTRIVGRWPSGQPLMRQIANPDHPENPMALNHFGFADSVAGGGA